MRDLIISTIEKNFATEGIGRLPEPLFTPDVLVTLREVTCGKSELLNPWLKSLTDEQLLGVLESQHCEMYR